MIGKEGRGRSFQATLYGLESHRQTLPYADLRMTRRTHNESNGLIGKIEEADGTRGIIVV